MNPQPQGEGSDAGAGADQALKSVLIRGEMLVLHSAEELEGGVVVAVGDVAIDGDVPGDSGAARHGVEEVAGEGHATAGGVEVDEAVDGVEVGGEAELE